jgi:mannonate dehydratase
VREAAAVYQHADGRDLKELEDHVREQLDQGMSHVRIRFGGASDLTRACGEAGGNAYGGPGLGAHHPPDGAPDGVYFDPQTYTRTTLEALAHVRSVFGDDIELLHDAHERLTPAQAVQFARDLEAFRLFFLEDPLAPEDLGWYERLRSATTTPIAASELFTGPNEWLPLVSGRLIDFVRMHVSDLGGLTPAKKAATVAEAFGVRTAWHGPGDVSPVGHAVNLHLNLASPNFGVQELIPFDDALHEVFPGCPEFRAGYLYANDKPGHGVDLDETLTAKYPCDPKTIQWTQARLPDGTHARP